MQMRDRLSIGDIENDPDHGGLRAKVQAAIADEIERFSPEQITASIIAQVRKGQQEVIWKILGMDNKWSNGWEIDHRNGRISPLSQLLAEHCKPALTEAVTEIAREVIAEMTVDPKARASLKKAFKQELQGYLDRGMRDTVRSRADDIAKEVIEDITKEVMAEAGL